MADNNRHSVNNADSTQPEIALEQKRTQEGRKLIAIFKPWEEIWKNFKPKLDIFHRLYEERMATSTNFSMMNRMAVGFQDTIERNPELIHRFNEVDEEAKLLLRLLEDFEEKLSQSGAIVKEFIERMRDHLVKLRKEVSTVLDAKAVEDMDIDVAVTNLDWTVPDPEMEELADYWDQMRLKNRTARLLNELMNLIHGNL